MQHTQSPQTLCLPKYPFPVHVLLAAHKFRDIADLVQLNLMHCHILGQLHAKDYQQIGWGKSSYAGAGYGHCYTAFPYSVKAEPKRHLSMRYSFVYV